MRFRTISSQKYVAQKCCIFYVRFPTEKETWYFADALYTWSFTVTSLMVQACSLMPCRSRFKVYVLGLLILFAAHQSGSPLSCVEDVTINLPGILEENVWEGTCSKGGGVDLQNWWLEGHNVLCLSEPTCIRLQTKIASDLNQSRPMVNTGIK